MTTIAGGSTRFSITFNPVRWTDMFHRDNGCSSSHPMTHFTWAMAASEQYLIYHNRKVRTFTDLWSYMSPTLRETFDRCAIAQHLSVSPVAMSIADRRGECREPMQEIRLKFYQRLCPDNMPLSTTLLQQAYSHGLFCDDDVLSTGAGRTSSPGVVPQLKRLVTANRRGGSQIW